MMSDMNPYIIRYYTKEADREFIYLVLEKCVCSLEELVERKISERSTMNEGRKLEAVSLFS